MRFTDYTIAQELARQFVPDRVKSGDWSSLANLCSRLGEHPSLRSLVERGTASNCTIIERTALIEQLADSVARMRPGRQEQEQALQGVLHVYARAFGVKEMAVSSKSPLFNQLLKATRAKLKLSSGAVSVSPAPSTPITPPAALPSARPESKLPALKTAPLVAQSSPLRFQPLNVIEERMGLRSPAPQADKSPPTPATLPETERLTVHGTRVQLIRDGSLPYWQQFHEAMTKLSALQPLWHSEPLRADLHEAFHEGLQSLQHAMERFRASILPPDSFHRREATVTKILQELGVSGESPCPPQLLALLHIPAEWDPLTQIVAELQRLDQSGLPEWLWPGVLPKDQRSTRALAAWVLRQDPRLRNELRDCVTWLEAQNAERRKAAAASLPPEITGTCIERLTYATEHLEQKRSLEGALNARLDLLEGFLVPALLAECRAALTDPRTQPLIERAEQWKARAASLAEILHPSAMQELLRHLGDLAEGKDQIFDVLEHCETLLPPEDLRVIASLSPLKRMAGMHLSTMPPAPLPAPVSAPAEASGALLTRVSHPLSQRVGNSFSTYAANLVWSRQSSQDPYGLISFPIRLHFEPVPTERLELTLEVTSNFLKDTPSEWRQYASKTLLVDAGQSRLDIELILPMTKGRADLVSAENRNIALQFQFTSDAWQGVTTHTLSWKGLSLEMPTFASPFHQTIDPDVMIERPLGIERRFTEVLNHIRAGERSFLVSGQRRFGKSTLLRALFERSKDFDDVAVLPLVTASAKSDVAAVWREIGMRLQTRFSRPVGHELEDGLLPSDDAFNAVREEAAKQNLRTLYLLIDEAQALFLLSDQPHRLGECLKQRLENSWGRRENGRASIQLGLVGQMHLPELLGSDLQGAISATFPAEPLREEDLLPILRAYASKGVLQSSAEARQRLAELAGNIWILDKLLEEVSRGCVETRRGWFIESDVERAATRLVESYRQGIDQTLWKYVRDVLNDSDDIDEWTPSETYLVALAWARARAEGATSLEALHERARALLQTWDPSSHILETRVKESVIRLRQQHVLRDDGRFQIPMLEQLLLVRANAASPLQGEHEHEALQRLGLRRISPPARRATSRDGEQNGAEGGQAHVYRSDYEEKDVAIRCVRLDSAKAQQRFIHEVRLLERLAQASPADRPSAMANLPKFIRAGFDDTDPKRGIVIYHWVEGAPLAPRSLSELAAISLGNNLAAVLAVLDELKIVHRDIRPSNILLRTKSHEPVLIDFGLGRAIEDLQRDSNSIAGIARYLPPEVMLRGSREWSAKGDLYSLGQTMLECIADPNESPLGLKALLTRMVDEKPERRPSPVAAAEEFRAMVEKSRLEILRNEATLNVRKWAEQMPAYVRPLMDRARGDFWACRLGILGRTEEKLAAIAEFLEDVLESFILKEHPDLKEHFHERHGNTYLRKVKDLADRKLLPEKLKRLNTPSAAAVGLLRNANAHRADFEDNLKKAYRALNQQRPMTEEGRNKSHVLIQAVQTVAAGLGHASEAKAIPEFVNDWLSFRK